MTLAAHTKVDECSIAGPMSQNLDEPVSRPAAAAAVVAASMGGKAGRGWSRSFQHGCRLLLEGLASRGNMNKVVARCWGGITCTSGLLRLGRWTFS